MKLLEPNNTIEQIGTITEENTFKMKSSRKAFQILSDLYSDKPLAIVRELGCNASDAMRAAGKGDQPFHIHIPNDLEPWLVIEDFGTGISHKNVYDIYATYFESTKTNTNDQIGCLGLGSKSPFCYSDNFMVISTFDGTRNTYNAFFNQQNTPAIALMSTTTTTESNGVKIQIPIKSKDFHLFEKAVKKAFRFFDIKPNITGGKVDWYDEKPVFEGQGWKSYSNLECSFAVMGGVTYPIDSNKLDNDNVRMAYRAGMVINFEMGEIDFAPSREHLSYCDDTIKALNDKFNFIKKDFVSRMNDMISKQENIKDALNCVHTLVERFSYIDGLTIKDKIMWKGQDITNPVEFIRKLVDTTGCTTFYKPPYYRKKIQESIYPSMDSIWVYDDLATGAITRVKNFVIQNEGKRISLFNDKAYNALINSGFPADAFVGSSTLPAPVRKSRTSNGGTRQQRVKGVFNVYNIGNVDNKSWEANSMDGNDANTIYPKYYILKRNQDWSFSMEVEGIKKTISDKSDLVRLMRFLNISHDDVVMVPKQNLKYLPDTCMEFEQYVNDNADFSYDKDQFATAQCYRISPFSHIANLQSFKDLPAKNEFKQFVEYVCKASEVWDKVRHISSWLSTEETDKGEIKKVNNKLVQDIIHKVGSYSWDAELVIRIIANLK